MKRYDVVRSKDGRLMVVEAVSRGGWVLCSWHVTENGVKTFHCDNFRIEELQTKPPASK